MKQLVEYIYPDSLQEALSLIVDDETRIIAGGTQLVPTKSKSIKRLVDITRIGLNYITFANGQIHVGSTTTITDMIESSTIQRIGKGVLTKACYLIGDTPLRNIITIGGNIARPMPWAGLPVVLLILNAQIVIINNNEVVKIVPSHEYFEMGGIRKRELIKEVIIPLDDDFIYKYEKFSLTAVDYSWLTLGLSALINKKKITDPCVAISRITKPQRLNKVENILINKNIDNLDFDEISSILTESVNIVSDYRSSAEYRTQILKILFKRMLIDLQKEICD